VSDLAKVADSGENITEQAAQVLRAIGVTHRGMGVVLASLLPHFANLVILEALEARKNVLDETISGLDVGTYR
jgi:hypothetical protein